MNLIESMEVAVESHEEIHDGSHKEEQDESWKHKSKSRIHQGEIIEGKREKKTVQRLDMQVVKPKEKPKIESMGKGEKLGDIARVNHAIGRLKAPLLKPLHKILYDRPGAVASFRKHLRLFNGFPFEVDSDPYNKKREKMTRLPKVQLKTMCQILDLERSGTQAVLVDRVLQFLVNPTNSGKPVIVKKKRKKKTTKEAKREQKTLTKSKKQQPESGKSKAIVTDSSSDEEEDDEDEGESKNKDTETSSVSDSRKHEGDESNSEEEEKSSDVEDAEDDEASKAKSKKPSSKKKSTPKKAVKKAEDSSDQSLSEDNDSAEDAVGKKTKKKPTAQKKMPDKRHPKTKKADSSSNRKKNTPSKSKVKSESSDDDEPLIKMIKRPPTNEQLKGAVTDLLEDANLEEVTMKQICQQVYDLYPDFDLTDRKGFIKETVKSIIS